MEKWESHRAVGRDVNSVLPPWRIVWRLFNKLRINLSRDPAVPLLGTYPCTPRSRHTRIPAFTAAPFTTARTRKEPRCPSTDECIKKAGNVCTMEPYLAMKGTHLSQL